MKLLLDTHIWIWLVLGSERLPQKIKKQLENPDNELWLSPISCWETMMLHAKKRIHLAKGAQEWVREALDVYPFCEATINHEVAIKSREIILPQEDPADHFIAATALIYNLTLVTLDKHLQQEKWLPTLANK